MNVHQIAGSSEWGCVQGEVNESESLRSGRSVKRSCACWPLDPTASLSLLDQWHHLSSATSMSERRIMPAVLSPKVVDAALGVCLLSTPRHQSVDNPTHDSLPSPAMPSPRVADKGFDNRDPLFTKEFSLRLVAPAQLAKMKRYQRCHRVAEIYHSPLMQELLEKGILRVNRTLKTVFCKALLLADAVGYDLARLSQRDYGDEELETIGYVFLGKGKLGNETVFDSSLLSQRLGHVVAVLDRVDSLLRQKAFEGTTSEDYVTFRALVECIHWFWFVSDPVTQKTVKEFKLRTMVADLEPQARRHPFASKIICLCASVALASAKADKCLFT